MPVRGAAATGTLKKPAWLNDPLNYHDRGNIDFGSCSQQCFEQGDFFGLDDLFTEKPNVVNGLAQIYASWVTRFHVDGFRVDTAQARQRRVLQALGAADQGGGAGGRRPPTSRSSAR